MRIDLEIKGMHCLDCAAKVERAVASLPGVKAARVSFGTGRLVVEPAGGGLDLTAIRRCLEARGYQVKTTAGPQPKVILTTASGGLTGLGMLLILLGYGQAVTVPLYLVAVLTGGFYIARRGLLAARQLKADINLLMTVAVMGAMLIGEWAEAATVTFLFALVELLESWSMDRARNAIRSLMELAPPQALVRQNGREETVPVEEVRLGDILIVKPGEKIPLDGRVVKGTSDINQAPITGESMPVKKQEGDEVFAGTINQQGALEIEVTHLARDTTLARIIHLVEEAQAQKAPSQRFVEQFARYYTPSVVVGAILVATIPPLVFSEPFSLWFYRALVLLVISCPCALVISTPVTIVSGLAAAAEGGVLIKGGRYLEGIGGVRVIAFDKTGTLTRGTPTVTDILASSQFSVHSSQNNPAPAVNREPLTVNSDQREVLRIAAAIEARSEHHLAQAILAKARELHLEWPEVEEFLAQTGRGVQARVEGRTYFLGNHRLAEEMGFCSSEVEAKLRDLEREGKTTVILGTEPEAVGVIAIADQIRPQVPEVLQALKSAGIAKLVMLTGDNRGTAEAMARQLAIDEYLAELLPEDKVEKVREMSRQYGNVAMVGDGVNDAPALAAASIGIAMGAAGTDQALETADVALMADDLTKLPFAIMLSQRAVRIVKQNITLSLAIKALFLALVIPGYATLWMAVAADMGASLLVIFNGLRLLRLSPLDSPGQY